MALNLESGRDVRVTISKHITRAAAKKTLERIFMQDKAVVAPLDARSANFLPIPGRRGGRIWTKHANKIHPELEVGASAKIRVTPQAIRDLNSVEKFISVA
jgi:hypothetical protein